MKKEMLPEELKRLRESLGWSQSQLGEEVDVASNTIARWERGASPVPKAVARLVRLLAAEAAPSVVKSSRGIARDPHHAAILDALSGHLDPHVFEACAADLLQQQWPGVVPVRGGSDDGFDGAVANDRGEPFPLVTTTGTNAKDNLKRNLNRCIENGWKPKTAIFATSRRVTPKTRKAMRDIARTLGVTLTQVYDQEWFANALYRETGWTERLLGVTGRPSALSVVPLSSRPVIGDRVIGREACLEQLREMARDCALIGDPGAGKTFVLRRLVLEGAALFLTDNDREAIANAIREQTPATIVVDDAHVNLDSLQMLRHLRAELGAAFRIIAAGWCSHTDELKSALNLVNSDVIELERLDRDTMVEVVKATGVHGPTPLIREIVDQAGGRPGLATTLAYLCLRGDVRDVFIGESLVAQLAPILKKLVGEDVSILLGAFSLAGDAGCTIETVASYLGRPIGEVSRILTELSVAGVIREGHERNISIWPAAFRWVLIRQVFFGGPGSLDYQNLFSEVADKESALIALLGARSRGASIPELETLLEQNQSTQLWSLYAELGVQETKYVLARHPELTTDIASISLLHVPEQAIPSLLSAAVGDDRTLHNSLDHPLRKIEDWMAEREEYAGPRSERRSILMDGVKAWCLKQNGHGDQTEIFRTALRALTVVFTPAWKFGETDPGRGRLFTFSTGIPGEIEMEAIQDLWSAEKAFVQEIAVASEAWTELLQLVREWDSYLGIDASDEIVELRRNFARKMVRDLAAWSSELPGVQHTLGEIADSLDISVPLNLESEFEILFPQESLKGFRDQEEEWVAKAAELATSWSKLNPSVVATKVAQAQRQADVAHINYPRLVPNVSMVVAKTATDPSKWAKEFIDKDAPADAVQPFLEQVAKDVPGDVETLLKHCLQLDRYRWLAISILTTMESPPPELFALATEQSGNFQQLVEVNCLRGLVPPETLRALLTASDDRTAIAAVVGAWNADRKDRNELPCREEWESAVLRSAKVEEFANSNGYWIGEILKSEPPLAHRWLIELLTSEHPFLHYEQKEIAKKATSSLDKDQRIALLGKMKPDPVARELAKYIVGDDLDVYRALLQQEALSKLQLEPLEGLPSEVWVSKAIAALDAGYTVDDIIGATQPGSYTWSGSLSEMWVGWRNAYGAFQNHTDRRIAKVAKQGVEMTDKIIERERERERLEEL